MRVRPYQDGDAEALAKIFFSAVRQVAGAHYRLQQVVAWAPAVPAAARFRARAADGRTVLVAVDETGVPVAYIDCEGDGHIDHVFCRPDHAGRGVTATLYGELEAVARQSGLSRLYVEASEPARRFFEKQGFRVLSRNDLAIDGVPIHNWRMEKALQF